MWMNKSHGQSGRRLGPRSSSRACLQSACLALSRRESFVLRLCLILALVDGVISAWLSLFPFFFFFPYYYYFLLFHMYWKKRWRGKGKDIRYSHRVGSPTPWLAWLQMGTRGPLPLPFIHPRTLTARLLSLDFCLCYLIHTFGTLAETHSHWSSLTLMNARRTNSRARTRWTHKRTCMEGAHMNLNSSTYCVHVYSMRVLTCMASTSSHVHLFFIIKIPYFHSFTHSFSCCKANNLRPTWCLPASNL